MYLTTQQLQGLLDVSTEPTVKLCYHGMRTFHVCENESDTVSGTVFFVRIVGHMVTEMDHENPETWPTRESVPDHKLFSLDLVMTDEMLADFKKRVTTVELESDICRVAGPRESRTGFWTRLFSKDDDGKGNR